MRKTIHLCARNGILPLRCVACGEIARNIAESESLPLTGHPAVCVNPSDWDTIYRDHAEYRRCIDDPDQRDQPPTRFPTPTEIGYYWAEWRVAEDGTYSEGVDHIIGFHAEVVWVIDNDDYYPDDPRDEPEFVVKVFGFETEQQLDNFVWRSGLLASPDEKSK
jgi:hypothetical protein